MSKHILIISATDQIKSMFKRKFEMDVNDDNLHCVWGFDAPTGGYYIQIWAVDSDDNDNYIEDGLMGGSKNRIFEKLEKYGILSEVRIFSPNHFDNLCLDLPF